MKAALIAASLAAALAAGAALGAPAALAAGAALAAPQPKAARCVIESAGAPAYRGPCLVRSKRGGSFVVTRGRRQSFPNGVGSISLDVVEAGLGEVRGLTREGINSRWGSARRDSRDRACWAGADFRICVY